MGTRCCSHLALADGCHEMSSPPKDMAVSQRLTVGPNRVVTCRAVSLSASPHPGLNIKPPLAKSMWCESAERKWLEVVYQVAE